MSLVFCFSMKCGFLFLYPALDSLGLLKLRTGMFHENWKSFSHYLFKNFSPFCHPLIFQLYACCISSLCHIFVFLLYFSSFFRETSRSPILSSSVSNLLPYPLSLIILLFFLKVVFVSLLHLTRLF